MKAVANVSFEIHQQPNYYNQQATYGNTQQAQYGTQQNNTTANTMQARKLAEKLEGLSRFLPIFWWDAEKVESDFKIPRH